MYNQLFASINKLVPLSADDKNKIRSAFEYKKYAKKEFLVESGAVCTHVNFIVSGYVKKTAFTEAGIERVLLLYSKNMWSIVMESFVKQIPSVYNVQSISDVEVLQVSYDKLQQLYDEVPAINTFFRKLSENGLIIVHKRIISEHDVPAKTQYLEFIARFPDIAQNVPQYLIASYLGVSKEFLSRLKYKIKQENKRLKKK